MKLEKAQPSFVPVTITIESQEELDVLLICLNCSPAGMGTRTVYSKDLHYDNELHGRVHAQMFNTVNDSY